jgi:hypothetical protein
VTEALTTGVIPSGTNSQPAEVSDVCVGGLLVPEGLIHHYYHWTDVCVGGLLIPEGIIPVVSVSITVVIPG